MRSPLSPTQRDVFFEILHKKMRFYIGGSICLGQSIQRDAWEKAVLNVYQSEPILHSYVEFDQEGLFQKISENHQITLHYQDLDLENESEVFSWLFSLKDLIENESSVSGFPHHWLVKNSDGKFYAAIFVSHLFFDGHSVRIFFEKTYQFYQNLIENEKPGQISKPLFYTYIQSVINLFDSKSTTEFWEQRLKNIDPIIFSNMDGEQGEYFSSEFLLSPELTLKIMQYCEKEGISVSNFFLAILAFLLQKFNYNLNEWPIYAIKGTRTTEYRNTIGCFYSVLPYLVKKQIFSSESYISPVFHYFQSYRQRVKPFQWISMMKLNQIIPTRGGRVIYNFYDFAVAEIFGGKRHIETIFTIPPDEMHLIVTRKNNSLLIKVLFYTNFFNDKRFLSRMNNICTQIVNGVDKVHFLNPLLDDEVEFFKQQAVLAGRDNAPVIDIIHRFEYQIEKNFHRKAIIFLENYWTYRELHEYTNQLGRYLAGRGVGRNSLVALYLDRSFEQVATIISILKVGGVYLPIDTEYPEERVRFILQDSCAKFLIVKNRRSLPFYLSDICLIVLDEVSEEILRLDTSNLQYKTDLSDTAYVIYTSGSTGRPKGTLISRFNLSRLFQVTEDIFAFTNNDIWPMLHSYAFDFSVWEMWGALAYGGTLIVVPVCVARSPDAILGLIQGSGITVLNQTPSAFYPLMDLLLCRNVQDISLRYIIFGGEKLDFHKLSTWFSSFDEEKISLVNMYGITETTVHVTYKYISKSEMGFFNGSPIGKPLPDLGIVLMSDAGEPVPIGVAGEIWVSGDGVGKGYLNRPKLSKEKFLDNFDLFGVPSRVYRTGDLASWLPSGELYFLGRIDDQVKIRGFRVEPDEIASILRTHQSIANVAVLPYITKNEEILLAAYIVLKPGKEISISELRQFQQEHLPSYMICTQYIFLPELPVTTHGKIDTRALPDPNSFPVLTGTEYLPPRTTLEEILCNIFSEVTGVEKVGLQDDFFYLGGNSLSAIQLVTKIQNIVGRSITIPMIFEYPTVSRLLEELEKTKNDVITLPEFIPFTGGPEYPLTYAQERVFIIQKLHPESVAYNFEAFIIIHGRTDVHVLKDSLARLIERHAVLRTTFHVKRGHPVQYVHDTMHTPFKVIPMDHKIASTAWGFIEKWRDENSQRPFDIERLPLVEWTLFQMSDTLSVLHHREHHLLHDGWSFLVIVDELFKLYTAGLQGSKLNLPELKLQIGDFAYIQRHWFEKTVKIDQLNYWKEKLKNSIISVDLSFAAINSLDQSYKGTCMRLKVPSEYAKNINIFCREEGVTPFILMLGSFVLLLYRYNGQKDLCIGSGVAGRRWKESESIVGMILNNLILRFSLDDSLSFRDFIKGVKETLIEALNNQDAPYDLVLQQLQNEASKGMVKGCNVFFSSYDGPFPDLHSGDTWFELEPGLSTKSAKFDLNVIFATLPSNPSCSCDMKIAGKKYLLLWEFSDAFPPDTMGRMVKHYLNLLKNATEQRDITLGEIQLLDPIESKIIRSFWNGPSTPYPADSTIHGVFKKVVEEYPNHIAIVENGKTITYQQLERYTNQLAHFLTYQGARCGDIIGFCLPRSMNAIICMIAILKLGCAYLPLQERGPSQYNNYLIQDSELRIVLTNFKLAGQVGMVSSTKILFLDEILPIIDRYPSESLPLVQDPDLLACVLYTSGSSGEPKGVEVRHRGILRLLFGVSYFNFHTETSLLQLSPLSFDASSFEIWGALLYGLRLVVVPGDPPTLNTLDQFITRYGITSIWLTSSLFNAIIDEKPQILLPIHQLIVGGEALSVEHIRKAQYFLPDCQLINGYGPTENTTFSCCYRIPQKLPENLYSVPIGRPISNSAALILDHNMNPVPFGIVGEIYVGGDGLAKGYHRRPELTKQVFIANKFPEIKSHTLYKTGDLGCMMPDGVIEYKGRIDRQLKIHGYRIEPEEIESVINKIPHILRSSVQSVGPERRLVAYIVHDTRTALSPEILSETLSRQLPNYMIPEEYVFLEEFPLTSSGKIDINALIRNNQTISFKTADTLYQPGNAIEGILKRLFAELLGTEEFGVFTNFFQAGGHSLLVLRLIEKIYDIFGIEIPVPSLYSAPTISSLAELISREIKRQSDPIEQRTTMEKWKYIVPIKINGSEPPLFMIPGGDGGHLGLSIYSQICPYLSSERPFYGFKARGIDEKDSEPLAGSVEVIAREYIEELMQLQPNGPYFLAGGCIGGIIAYEMAIQLREMGESVGKLILLDTIYPGWKPYFTSIFRGICSRIRFRLMEFLSISGLQSRNYLGRKAREVFSEKSRMDFYKTLSELLPYSERDANPFNRPEWIEFNKITLKYYPKNYQGNVDFIFSEESSKMKFINYWIEKVKPYGTIHIIPGDHWSYIRENIRLTGLTVRKILDET